MVHGYLWAQSAEFAALAEATLAELHWSVRFLEPDTQLPSSLSEAWLLIVEAAEGQRSVDLDRVLRSVREQAPGIGILLLGQTDEDTELRLRREGVRIEPMPGSSGDLGDLIGRMLVMASHASSAGVAAGGTRASAE